MLTVGIWERDGGLTGLLKNLLPGEVREGLTLLPAGCRLPGRAIDLGIVSPHWRGETEGCSCRCLLAPGTGIPTNLTADWAVSYGLSPRDTLTISSMDGGRLCVALQREVVTLEGTVRERQELPLDNGEHLPPLEALACVGVQLLLGVPPEGVRLTGLAPQAGGVV